MKGLSKPTFATPGRAFQVSSAIQRREARCKRRIERRLRRRNWTAQLEPMLRGRNLHYEGSDRVRGLGAGGIGAMHLLAQRTGLTAAIDEGLELLKVHQPYHESDHVLNIAYNILCGGKTLEDVEQRRSQSQSAAGVRLGSPKGYQSRKDLRGDDGSDAPLSTPRGGVGPAWGSPRV